MSQIITNVKQFYFNGSYTYADYLLWQFKGCVELIKDKILKMSPVSNWEHHNISLITKLFLSKFFNKQPCKIDFAPFDVQLINFKESTGNNNTVRVVHSYLYVICDATKLDDKPFIGLPDLIIKKLAPRNLNYKIDIKFDLYQNNCILAYSNVNRSERNICTVINNRKIRLKPLIESSNLINHTFPYLKFVVNKNLTYNI